QGVVSYFKTAITDSGGHYELRGVAPGKYRLFAFEDMEPLAYQNPQFVRRLDGLGQEVSITQSGKVTKDLTLEGWK
ncbi:MAG: hypothetical protein JWO80_3015, partial [Bryobacterales bacterium]|nr:hypothetical protein [Bryobacterales bacterium]